MGRYTRAYSIRLVLIPAVLVALLIWVSTRWSVWFGNPDELAYVPLEKPGRVLLSMADSPSARTLSWQCGDEPQEAWVDWYVLGPLSDSSSAYVTIVYSKAVVGQRFESRSGASVYYSTVLDSLAENTSYAYRIRVGADSTDWFHLETSDDPNFSFLHFGDVQDEVNGGFATLLPEIMARNKDVSFLTFGGDLIQRPMDCYWGEFFRAVSPYSSSYPIVAVPGNHEYLKGMTRTLENRFRLVFPYYDNYENEVARENAVFSFAYQNTRFFLLESNRDFWHFGAQRGWLSDELANCQEKWKIVILHHPIYSIKGAFNNLLVRASFNNIIQEAGVDLVLQGHEHGYARSAVDVQDGQMITPLYLVTYCSEKNYMLEFHGDVDKWGTDSRYYQRISFAGDTLTMETFNASHELYDRVRIVKNDTLGRIYMDEGQDIPEHVCVPKSFRKTKSAKKVKQFERNIEEWRQEKARGLNNPN